jgi:chromosome segregation ATPase
VKHFSKVHIRAINAQTETCAEAAKALEDAVDEYNKAMEQYREKIDEALTAYNSTLGDLREIYAGLQGEASEYLTGRSDKWQESAAGQQYQGWVDSMESIDGVSDDFDYALPEPLDKPDLPDWDDPNFLPSVAPDEAL